MGIDWACFRNDDRLGLAIGNFANEMTALYVSDQPASLQFSDLANLYGLGAPTQPPLKFGLFFFDYDLDGRLDLLSANGHLEPDISKVQASESYEQPAQLFWNTGKAGRNALRQGRPRDRRPRPLPADRRPRQRLCRHRRRRRPRRRLTVNNGPARLFRNDGGNANHWIRLVLTGDGKTSNRDAIGAKVEVKVGDQVCRRQLFPAKSYLSSVELPLTFGLGKADKADEVTITWPSGKSTTLKDLKANQIHKIQEVDARDHRLNWMRPPTRSRLDTGGRPTEFENKSIVLMGKAGGAEVETFRTEPALQVRPTFAVRQEGRLGPTS